MILFAAHPNRADVADMNATTSNAMSPHADKILLGATTLLGYAFTTCAALLSTGDSRWFLVTSAFAILTSGFLSLIFKRADETINLAAGRAGMGVLGGIFLTKYLAWQFNVVSVHTDTVALGGLASGATILMFIVGFKALRYLEKRSDFFAKKFIDSKIGTFIPDDKQDGK